VDPGLEAEGTARDVVRRVQEARRAAGLHVADRIELVLAVRGGKGSFVGTAIIAHQSWIIQQTLATSLEVIGTDESPPWACALPEGELGVYLRRG
ncbi:MAG: DUF5915 domain-containing protein, partial [Acidimicrobiales bacterium]